MPKIKEEQGAVAWRQYRERRLLKNEVSFPPLYTTSGSYNRDYYTPSFVTHFNKHAAPIRSLRACVSHTWPTMIIADNFHSLL